MTPELYHPQKRTLKMWKRLLFPVFSFGVLAVSATLTAESSHAQDEYPTDGGIRCGVTKICSFGSCETTKNYMMCTPSSKNCSDEGCTP
jgi:hypothetical protein